MKQISFREIVDTLVHNRLILLICLGGALLTGAFIYIITPNGYKSSVGLSIEGKRQIPGGLGNLASLAGINFDAGEGIDASVYAAIIESTPYLLEVVNKKVYFEGDSVYLKSYLVQGMATTFPQKLQLAFGNWDKSIIPADTSAEGGMEEESNRLRVINLQGEDRAAVFILKGRITYDNPRHGPPVLLEITLQDPSVSAQAARIAIEVLSKYVNDYERDRGNNRIDYIQSQLDKAEKKLYHAQNALAGAKDRNRNIISSFAQAELDRLNMEYQLAYNTYNSLAQQLEASRIRVEEEKPVFFVIEPPVLRSVNSPTEPRLILYLIFSIVLGTVAGITAVFIKTFLSRNS